MDARPFHRACSAYYAGSGSDVWRATQDVNEIQLHLYDFFDNKYQLSLIGARDKILL